MNKIDYFNIIFSLLESNFIYMVLVLAIDTEKEKHGPPIIATVT